MNKNQKGSTAILILVAIAVVAVIAYFLLTQKGKVTTVPTTGQNYPAIQSNSDLNKAASNLDSTDTKEMDSQLNQLSSDSSSF